MIIIGDEFIPFENIVTIDNINDINTTKANSTLVFEFEKKLLSYCHTNSLKYGVLITSLTEAIYANALNAKYIIAEKELSLKIQKSADNYMFDSRVLSIILSNKEIEEVAILEIDGVIYKRLLNIK